VSDYGHVIAVAQRQSRNLGVSGLLLSNSEDVALIAHILEALRHWNG